MRRQVATLLDEQEVEILDGICRQAGLSRSEVLRRCLLGEFLRPSEREGMA
jgi:hypothetical protein